MKLKAKMKKIISSMMAILVFSTSIGGGVKAEDPELVSVKVNIQGEGKVHLQTDKENFGWLEQSETIEVLKGEVLNINLQAEEGKEVSRLILSGAEGVMETLEFVTTKNYSKSIIVTESIEIIAEFTSPLHIQEVEEESSDDATVQIGGVKVPKELAKWIGKRRAFVVPNLTTPLRSAGDIVRITPGKMDYYGSWATNEFEVKSPEGTFLGFCAEPNAGTPAGNYTASILNNDFIKWCLIKYASEPQTFNLGQSYYSAAHAIIGYAYTGQTTGLNAGQIQAIQNFMNHPQIQQDLRDGVCRTSVNGNPVALNLSDYEAYIAINSQQDIVWMQEVPKGELQLVKKSSNPNLSDGNDCYSLEGAIYKVYSDSACTDEVGTFITAKTGESNVLRLKPGTYYVKESNAPKGYGLDATVYTNVVTKGQKTMVNGGVVTDAPQDDPLDVVLRKFDKETKEAYPLEKGSLKGAEYTYKYYKNYNASGEPDCTWVFVTDEDGIIRFDESYLKEGGDKLYKNAMGMTTIPLGSVTVQETKAPKGYKLDPKVYTYQILPVDNHATTIDEKGNKVSLLEVSLETTVEEQVKRGDISFNKISKESQDRMANVVFKVTAEKTGETHNIMTDENGFWSSESRFIPHSQNTNSGDSGGGTWFGTNANGTLAPVNDTLGAFPYGTYLFEEQKTEVNKHKKMISFSVTVNRDRYTVDAGTKTNENEAPISLYTKASVDGAKEVEEGKVVTITDVCTIKGLTKGQKYRLDGLQKLREEKATLVVDGKEVKGHTEFVATAENMEVEVKFTVDTTGLGGKTLVTFEKLYELGKPEKPVGTHEDYDDEGQSIKVKKNPGRIVTSMPNGSKGGAVKTGDTSQVAVWLSMVLLSGTGLIAFFRKRWMKKI